jgi:hypothetical protein
MIRFRPAANRSSMRSCQPHCDRKHDAPTLTTHENGRWDVRCLSSTSRYSVAVLAAAMLSLPLPSAKAADVPPLVLPATAVEQPQTRANASIPSHAAGRLPEPAPITVALPPLEPEKTQTREPNQNGVVRSLPRPAEAAPQLVKNPDGSQSRIWAIRSAGAKGLRVRFERFDLPARDAVYVYGTSPTSLVGGPYTSRGPSGASHFWSSSVEGDTIIVEHSTWSGAESPATAEVLHIVDDLSADTNAPDLLTCHQDASCYTSAARNAVARLHFIKNGIGYVCSGTLMNDRNSTRTPYLLTANHCIPSQSVAETLETYWLYRSTSCGSGVVSSSWRRSAGGADLLVTGRDSDYTLLRLNDSPPAGVTYAGWSTQEQPLGAAIFSFHHPGAAKPPSAESYLRRSAGRIGHLATGCSTSGLTNGYRVDWTSGAIEGGSSGSAIFFTTANGDYVTGVASCTSSPTTCDSYGIYGKFPNIYPQVRPWLDPASTVIVTPSAGAGGAISPDSPQVVNVGGSISLFATPAPDRWIKEWLVNGRAGFSTEDGLELMDVRTNTTVHVNFRPTKPDFDGDRQSDLIWQNDITGQRAIWGMNGTAHRREYLLPTVSTQWQIAGTGHFDNDDQVDIVWQNSATGQRAVWLMDGPRMVGERFLPTVAVEWQIVGTADFNNDRKVDLLWQNTRTGQCAIWLMNGTAHTGERLLPTVPLQWRIAATGDFNSDGKADIVWQNTSTGQRAVWLMDGPTWVGERFLPTVALQWEIAGTGEFNGDSHTDLVWQNHTTGQRAIWLMNGTAQSGERFLPTVPTQWSIRNR